MSTNEGLMCDSARDQVMGYEDMGIDKQLMYLSNHGLVVMVHSITDKWKQPLGHFLQLVTIMKDMLLIVTDKLVAAGFTPLTICYQGLNNRSLFTKLDLSIARPFRQGGEGTSCRRLSRSLMNITHRRNEPVRDDRGNHSTCI